MLVALETVSVAILSPVRQDIKSGCFRCVVQYHSMSYCYILIAFSQGCTFPQLLKINRMSNN